MTDSIRPLAACSFVLLSLLGGCPSDGGGSATAAAEGASSETESSSEGATEAAGATEGATGETETAGETETETAGATETEGEAHVDLFGCDLQRSCEQIVAHLDPEPYEAMQCAAEQLANGTPSVFSALDTPGPDIDETEYLIIYPSGSELIVQLRERHCDSGDDCPWEAPSPHYSCPIDTSVFVQACGAECDADCECAWDPFTLDLTQCEVIEDWTCEQAEEATTLG